MDDAKPKQVSTGKDRWAAWPETFKALTETYFDSRTFGNPGEVPANGNYMLAGLQRYDTTWQDNHGHHGVQRATLDRAAAHEVRYLWNRSRRFTRPAAALSACINNIALERPERILERMPRPMRKGTPTALAQIPLDK